MIVVAARRPPATVLGAGTRDVSVNPSLADSTRRGWAKCREEMIMAKLPKAPHPLPQLTSSELLTYIRQLREALNAKLSQGDRELVLGQLGKSYTEASERGLTVPAVAETPRGSPHGLIR